MSTILNEVWKSDKSGRSLFGLKIKEEIFAIFFILVIILLSNDENIVKKVNNDMYTQVFIIFTIMYCVYNHIPWSLAFILLFCVLLFFTDFIVSIQESVYKILKKIQKENHLKSNINKNVKKVRFKDDICNKVSDFLENDMSDVESECDMESEKEKLKTFMTQNLSK